jgi:hypothetical protein
MKIIPCIGKTFNDDTAPDPEIYTLFNNLIIIYLTQIINLSKLSMHDDLILKHYFSVYILKEIDSYRVVTCRSHIHEVYLGKEHYGNAVIIDENATVLNKNRSIYDTMEMDNSYKVLDINKIVFDFKQIFKHADQEKVLIEIIKF